MSRKPQDKDVAFIQAVAELLRANELTELQVKRDYGEGDSLDVRLCRTWPGAAPAAASPPAAPGPSASPEAPHAEPPGTTEPPEDPAQHPGAISSPMVGTVYLRPDPAAQPFVSEGSTVTEGETLLIVEAMKTMNPIPAPRDGTVARILVEDGAPVEYGAPLLLLV